MFVAISKKLLFDLFGEYISWLFFGVKFNLVYKATMHGDKASTFHEKCDNNHIIHEKNVILIDFILFPHYDTKEK